MDILIITKPAGYCQEKIYRIEPFEMSVDKPVYCRITGLRIYKFFVVEFDKSQCLYYIANIAS